MNIFFLTTFAQQPVPIPDWVKGIGGMGDCKVTGIAVDEFDNVIVAGNFQGRITVKPEGTNSFDLISAGSYDIFIFKYSPDGKLLSAQSFGGNGLDQLNNLDIDSNGNILMACVSNSVQIDCDPSQGVYNPTLHGGWDALMIKLHADGSLHWVRTVGSAGEDRGHVVTADQQGNIIFVGSFSGANVDVGQGWNLSYNGGMDGFMIKYNSIGEVQWAYAIGSGGTDEIKSVKTDSNNDIAILGYVAGSANINPKGPAQTINTNTQTYYLAKYSASGSLVWSNTLAGGNNISATVTINKSDDIYVNGVYSGGLTLNSQTGGPQTFNSAVANLYLAKYNSKGSLGWVRNVTGSSTYPDVYSYYIAADVNDNVYIGGYFNRTLVFGSNPNQKTLTFNGTRDTFFAKYNSAGDFIWAFNFGSPCTQNFGHKIAVDSKSNILLGGTFCKTVDFNPSSECKLELTAVNSAGDGYIAKYNQIKINGEDPFITDLTLEEQLSPAVINATNKTVTITVKPGTDVTQLSPKIEVDLGMIDPLSETPRDFTTPQKYTITTSCNDYEWTVIVLSQNIPCPPQSTIADAGDDQVYCDQAAISLTANTTNTGETGTWTVTSPAAYNPFNATNRNQPTVTLTNLPPNQEVIFKWTISNSTCTTISSDEVKITNFIGPAVLPVQTLYLKPGESRPIGIQVDDISPMIQASYLWLPTEGLDDPTVLNPTVAVTESQTYTLTISYGNNCTAVYAVDVSVLEQLQVPNAFSPNMDGTNDVWTIKHLDSYPDIEIMVFNRFGERVFYSEGYSQPWNGSYKGKILPSGTYFYLINFNKEKTKLSGSLTIIR